METKVLKKGEYLITDEALWVTTVLGSCVSVTLFSQVPRLAAICHAVLVRPGRDQEEPSSQAGLGRYVCEVLPLMLDHFFKRGCTPSRIQAKLFGGACISCKTTNPTNNPEVGLENTDAAVKILLAEGLRLRACNTGGLRPHRLLFNTADGEVRHQFIRLARPLT